MLRHLAIATLTLLVPLTAPAQQAQPQPKPPSSGWESMFNGKDLAGWVPVGNEKWTVEDGTIHGQGITKDYGYLRTEKKYVDFEMSLRFKCEADGNSGLFVHTDFKPGTADVSQGMQFEIDRTLNHHPTGLYGDGRQWIAWPAPELETVIRPNDWNDLWVSVIGNRYIARLNGVPMLDFTDPTPKSFDGYIALQLHSGGLGNMRFTDLYIRDLTKR
jgi:3-keto-disaccharide hydrolase